MFSPFSPLVAHCYILEWWLLKEAKQRNPAIKTYALSWAVPGWVGNGNFFSEDNIEYHLKWIQGLKRHHGINLDYLGLWYTFLRYLCSHAHYILLQTTK